MLEEDELLDALLDALLEPDLGADDVDDSVGGVVLDADGEAVLLAVADGVGSQGGHGHGGFGGWVGCVGRVDADVLLDGDGERVDVGVDERLDDEVGADDAVELGTADDERVEGDEPTVRTVCQGRVALCPGRLCAVPAGMRAPGSTRCVARVVDRTVLVGGSGAVVLVLTTSEEVLDGADTASSVLTGPPAPEPKSALRCTKPICSATREMPGTPPTAAATPEIDRVATVMAATTPSRAGVRLARA